MYLAFIDNLSVNGTSKIHTLHPIGKIVGFGLLFISTLLIANIVSALIILIILFILFKLGQIPVLKIWKLALYPAIFSLLFAFMKMWESWQAGILVVVHAVLAALTMLLLISTTPYYDIVDILSKFLPSLLVDVLFFTYRSFFILVDRIDSMLRSIKLRGGYHRRNWSLNIKNMAATLGVLIIHALEMSERMYMAYTLRGYDGKIHISRDKTKIDLYDVFFLCFCLVVLIGVIVCKDL